MLLSFRFIHPHCILKNSRVRAEFGWFDAEVVFYKIFGFPSNFKKLEIILWMLPPRVSVSCHPDFTLPSRPSALCLVKLSNCYNLKILRIAISSSVFFHSILSVNWHITFKIHSLFFVITINRLFFFSYN